jgi:ribosome-interacting GTPase 1
LLDLPGIIEGAAHGEGRGREVIAVAKSADLVLIVLDAVREVEQHHKEILERELRTVGLRLNQTKPNITFKEKPTGGIVFAATCPITKLGDDPRRTVYQICKVRRRALLSNRFCVCREVTLRGKK